MTELDAFERELTSLIHKHGLGVDSHTPDWILANYLRECLTEFNGAVITRDIWYKRDNEISPNVKSASKSLEQAHESNE